MTKRNLLTLTAAFALLMVIAGSVQAATYYVRTDGGTTSQCTGLADAPYAGTGTNQACAFNHPFWGISVAGAPMKMVGGDTLIIGPGQYMMGFGAPNASVCSQYWPYDCKMRAIPSGTSTNPTRILGKGWDTGCSSKPQLWGTERSASVMDLRGSSNVQIQCLEITDHSSCMEFGPDQATLCKRNKYPFGPWATNGIVAQDSQNVLLKNVYIHGLKRGILGGRLTDWTMENVDIIGNSSAGFDGDIGASVSSNSGKIIFKNSRIMWSGCGETYPGLQPHHCYGQSQGGYGDGLGTNKTGGDWVFDHVDFTHNTSDGLDLLYHNGNGTITISHSRFEGNASNQVKVATSTVIDNSKLIGNCAFFEGKPFTATTNYTNFQPTAFGNCRALGNTLVFSFKPGMKAEVYNSTITGNGDSLVISNGASCLSTDKIVSKNNIFLGGVSFLYQADVTDLYYASGATGNGDGACGTLPMSTSSDIIWATKYNNMECTGNTSKCVDPKLKGPFTFGGDNIDVSLQDGSPTINAGVEMTSLPNTDYNNFDRGASWDVGALEYGSISTTPSTPAPTPEPTPIPTSELTLDPTLDPTSEPMPDPASVPAPVCGNGVVNTGEQCDDSNLNNNDGCSSACLVELQLICGNGVKEGTEICDDGNLNNNDGCNSTCRAEYCGDGIKQTKEQCDDGNWVNRDGCSALCITEVPLCGNGMIEGSEQCDGGNLNGQTCTSKGFTGGSLACSSSCTFNTSSCLATLCGNGVVETGEQCDGANLNGQTCASKGFAGGSLACSSFCTFNTADCKTSICGNGIIEIKEQCDGSNLNAQTCVTKGFAAGSLSCSSCAFDTSSCLTTFCGNEVVEVGEQCDGSNFNGQTCANYRFNSGTLTCLSSCMISADACKTVRNKNLIF